MLFIGIDPGKSGGIAFLDEDGRVVWVGKMPDTDGDIAECLETAGGQRGNSGPSRAVIEKVNPGVFGRPGARMGAVSAFTFGGIYRALRMALTCERIPFDEVLPVKWQTALGCCSKGDKNITKARAQQLFPGVKVTHAIADALLLAEFCRRMEAERRRDDHRSQLGLDDGQAADTSVSAEGKEGIARQEPAETRSHWHVARHGRSRHP